MELSQALGEQCVAAGTAAALDIAHMHDKGKIFPIDLLQLARELDFFQGVVGRIADDGEGKARRGLGLGRQRKQRASASASQRTIRIRGF